MDDLKTQLQQVREHRRATFSSINDLERKRAEKSQFFSQQFAEATLNGVDTSSIAETWAFELNKIEEQLKQHQEVQDVFSVKEKELQIAIDDAHREEQTIIYNDFCAKRVELNKKVAKLIRQLGETVEQLDEITRKQRTASAIGKLDSPVSAMAACWYVKQAIIQQLRSTSAKFDEMLLTHDADILKTGDKFAYPLTFKESVTHE